jgi:hypothetical protein
MIIDDQPSIQDATLAALTGCFTWNKTRTQFPSPISTEFASFTFTSPRRFLSQRGHLLDRALTRRELRGKGERPFSQDRRAAAGNRAFEAGLS